MELNVLGQAALTGWRRNLVDRIGPHIARRTPLSLARVRALAGAVFFATALAYVVRALARARRAAR